MSNIRHLVENHLPLQLTPGTSEGMALISSEDLQELTMLAGKDLTARVVSYTPMILEASVEELKALMLQAHTNLHGDGPSEVVASTDEETEDDEQDRLIAVQFAMQIIVAKLTHGSSIDALEVTNSSVVDQAEAILKFLKGA